MKSHSHNTQLIVVPARVDYAHRPIIEGFSWMPIIDHITHWRKLDPSSALYLVVFRSQRAPGVDERVLAEHDERAHVEAQRSPALLYYFGGSMDDEGYALSFCLWTDAASARAATVHAPRHKEAVGIASTMYTSFRLERYDVHRVDGEVVFRPVLPAARVG